MCNSVSFELGTFVDGNSIKKDTICTTAVNIMAPDKKIKTVIIFPEN